MAVVYLTTRGTHVRRKGERLEVWEGKKKTGDVQMFDLERLVVVGSVQLSTAALALLLDKGVDVSFLTGSGRLRGSLISAASRNVFLRLAQYDRWKDPPFRLAFSRHVVSAKLTAQQRVLARWQRNHPNGLDADAVARLSELAAKVPEADSIDTLRGLEGTAAAVYYGQFGTMVAPLPFPGRKQHPSTDPANALLSLGYVMVGNEIGGRLEAQGLDPAVGFLHGLRYGRSSLALDVVEAYRQPVVDRLTLRLLNLKQITPADFEGGPNGLRLGAEAFKKYLSLFDEQMRSPSEGEGSSTWRHRLDQEAEALRAMVMDGEARSLYIWAG